MNRTLRRQRGTAAMEMAVVTMLSVVVLAMIVLAGRATWHATALTKSVANTARIVATLPRPALVSRTDFVEVFAEANLLDATQSAGIDLQPNHRDFDAECGNGACEDRDFTSVTVRSAISFRDTIFDGDFQNIGLDSLDIISESRQTYATATPAVPTN
jgi:hypothetical protein